MVADRQGRRHEGRVGFEAAGIDAAFVRAAPVHRQEILAAANRHGTSHRLARCSDMSEVGEDRSDRPAVHTAPLTRNGYWQSDRFRGQPPHSQHLALLLPARYLWSQVPNSYRTWIKVSAGASNISRGIFALQSISPISAKSRQRFCRIRPWECINIFQGKPR